MLQPRERANAYLGKAKGCRLAAELTDNPEARATYLDLARRLETLAHRMERPEGEREPE
jgi:hypothetical protein